MLQLGFRETVDAKELLEVLVAVRRGDFSVRMPVSRTGLPGKIADALNDVIEANARMAGEFARIRAAVGREGQTLERASVPDATGGWAACVDSVNGLVGDLIRPTHEMARVIGAVARGDLTQTMALEIEGRPLEGEFLHTARVVNGMVEQLASFASEVTRVAREVGTEGKLGGQAHVKGVAGTWKDLTDSVNSMAGNLTGQVRNIAEVTTAIANGDLSKKITVDVRGEILQLKDTINRMVDQLRAFAAEVTRVAREVGTEGKLGGQAVVPGVAGTWKDLTEGVNSLASNLTSQVRNIADVTTAVAKGDLSKKITVDVKGEILQLKDTVNTMVDQLRAFAAEVTRVAREVGTEGKLGGQANVEGVAGTWKDLTDNVNLMASNLTGQVRNIATVTTAVANGDLSKKITVDVQGEILELKRTINTMVDQLGSFASEVTRVAREVGTDGRLGGQAEVKGVAGTWKDLTDNVNQLAANLTSQVRAIAEVATAVAQGDLTRSITVIAAGEVATLKDNINEMIRNLKETTRRNTEQDWLKTNLAKFMRTLQGQRDVATLANMLLSDVARLVDAQHGAFYAAEPDGTLCLLSSWAFTSRKSAQTRFSPGDGLIGQCALEKQRILVTNAPADYVQISSGLGQAPPCNIAVLPVVFEGEVKAVMELASFTKFSEVGLSFLEQLTEGTGIVLNTIAANTRTEELLKQSQALGGELKQQQAELQGANDELEQRARLLSEQKSEVERKNRDVESARRLLEEKAEQLVLTSKYKSEFLANMSHELRTPLNSLLILSRMLADNGDGNLTARQVEYARSILSSGSDLLVLIDDILDLSKIESGTMAIEVSTVRFDAIRDFVEGTFRQVAELRRLEFSIEIGRDLPLSMRTDDRRLQQVLKNLLSNAFKFTDEGAVTLTVSRATGGWHPENTSLGQAERVVAFAVADTGIGIPADKHQIIFEAFQQADGTTSRKYGGTGLGLSISREIARMLGGEIRLDSTPGTGSTFTLFLPLAVAIADARAADDLPVDAEDAAAANDPTSTTNPHFSAVGDEPLLVVVDEDASRANDLSDLVRTVGFRASIAADAAAVPRMMRESESSAIAIDLSGGPGWTLLDRLKHDPAMRHHPVLAMGSAGDRERALRMGAAAFHDSAADSASLSGAIARVKALLERPVRNLLVVEADDQKRRSILEIIGNGDVDATAVATADEALTLLAARPFDCVVLDPRLPDRPGSDVVERMRVDPLLRDVPVVVYAAADETSPGRLLDETMLHLHRREAGLPADKQRLLEEVHREDPLLAGRSVLIVDDDVRNIFALTAILERRRMRVRFAENGRDGLTILERNPEIDIVLMDVMMPGMDGYETMRAIRRMPGYASLPILALTAKAMKGDREKCLEAGASDYIAKPVDTDQLLSLLRVHLERGARARP